MPQNENLSPDQIFSKMLKSRREKAGLTQRQLASLLEKPQSWICRHERGDLRMDYMELRAYLRALDVSVVAFVTGLERKLGELDDE